MAVEQLLGGAGGSWTVRGAPESGRDLRQIVPRRATRRRRPGVGKDEEGSFGERAESEFENEAVGVNVRLLRVRRHGHSARASSGDHWQREGPA